MNEDVEIVELGRYPDFSTAAERALVVIALGGAYWLFEEKGEFILFVESREADRFETELAEFEKEERERTPPPAPTETSPASLFAYAWVLSLCYLVQSEAPRRWIDLGAASRAAIFDDGEWWRTLTALTLHGDLLHLLTNTAFGILYAWALLPALGPALTWWTFVATGALGNLGSALIHASEPIRSIGASAAVFGLLGALVTVRIAAWRIAHRRLTPRDLLLPLGAGCALLALLGSETRSLAGQPIDHVAHMSGFVAGLALGPAMYLLGRLPRRELALGLALFAAVGTAWALALSAG